MLLARLAQAKTKASACQRLQQQLVNILSTQQIIKAVKIRKPFLVECASHALQRLPLTRFRCAFFFV